MTRDAAARWLARGRRGGRLALAPASGARASTIRARATRLGRAGGDPVAPFREAPCYEHDRIGRGRVRAHRGRPIAPTWHARGAGPDPPDRLRAARATRSSSCAAPRPRRTFGAYRGLPDAVHGMIAWPNTVLLTRPGERGGGPRLHDPGRHAGRGARRPRAGARRRAHRRSPPTCTPTTCRPCPQLGRGGPARPRGRARRRAHAAAVRGALDRATVHPLSGRVRRGAARACAGSSRPAHTDGHVAYLVDTDEGTVAIVGDTPGPDPAWFARHGPARGLPAPRRAPYGVPRDPRGGPAAHDSRGTTRPWICP